MVSGIRLSVMVVKDIEVNLKSRSFAWSVMSFRLMSQLCCSAPGGVSCFLASGGPSVRPWGPSSFVCELQGRPPSASSPGSTGWWDPSLAGWGWSAGLCTALCWASRRWTGEAARQEQWIRSGWCWRCGRKGPPAEVWPACAWSSSRLRCTGKPLHQRAGESAGEDPALYEQPVHHSGSETHTLLEKKIRF